MNDSLIVSIFDKGGFFVYPILICSIIALSIFLKRLYLTRKENIITSGFEANLEKHIAQGNFDTAINFCERDPSIFSQIAIVALVNRERPISELEKMIEDEGSKQIFALSKSNEMLGSLSNVSTLLGLLGTISGMITVFKVISTQTVVDPPSLAGGISEALYTTAFGLLVAIPSFIGYKFLMNRINEIAIMLQIESKKLLSKIKD
ncbi:MAG: MotA/TolQ/ExbB proton channel family protein [Thermodesulfobacteriota bacterium]|nr:MotA/TolQ/ExbB proton channel family protein [Thermodesulfobacteriota bacterium]